MGKKTNAAKAEMERKAQDVKQKGVMRRGTQMNEDDVAKIVPRPPKDRFYRPVPERTSSR